MIQNLLALLKKFQELAQDAEVWLILLDKHHIDEFISPQNQIESNLQELTTIKESVLKAKGSKVN
jgi:hypothetical protein